MKKSIFLLAVSMLFVLAVKAQTSPAPKPKPAPAPAATSQRAPGTQAPAQTPATRPAQTPSQTPSTAPTTKSSAPAKRNVRMKRAVPAPQSAKRAQSVQQK
jgi:hypothetical protein